MTPHEQALQRIQAAGKAAAEQYGRPGQTSEPWWAEYECDWQWFGSPQTTHVRIPASAIRAALTLLAPFAERFYEDAMSLVFDIAADAGFHVEMLTYETKQQWGAPMDIYTDLPKRMGMKKRPNSKALPTLPGVWHLVPNRRRAH